MSLGSQEIYRSNFKGDKDVTFNTKEVILYSKIPALANAKPADLLAEPSMNQASVDFALENGGPITVEVIETLKNILGEEEAENMRIDTKVQIIPPDSYANDPGWHSDYFGGYDEGAGHLIQYNPSLEPDTRIFLITSGEPATEFLTTRNLSLNFHQDSWEKVSDTIESMIDPNALYRIPLATPVEMTGDEIHRVTLYEGAEPTTRYFLRATVFPQEHSDFGIYQNQFFEWKTVADASSILGDAEDFLARAFSHLEEKNVDVSQFDLAHLCYRVATNEEYDQKKAMLLKVGTLVSEVNADGRPYAVFKLNHPIVYGDYQVSLIAMPAPKPDNQYASGWQHVAFVMDEDLRTLLKSYPDLEFDTLELDRPVHSELKLRFDDLVVKFHNESLEDLV